MRSRILLVVRTGEPVGEVGLGEDGAAYFNGGAEDAFAGLRNRMGDQKLLAELLANGWSNGYLYLAPEAS